MSTVKALGVVLGSVLLLAGCATKSYVRQQVAPVQTQVSEQQQQIQTLGGRADNLDQGVRDAMARAMAAQKLAQGKFLYTVTGSDSLSSFKFDSAKLSDDFKGQLADLADKLKSANRNAYLEIQGYTDRAGTPQYNYRLGWDRAEAVRRFLSQQGVALNRMATISYGEDMQIEGNRKDNRRVVIVVLE